MALVVFDRVKESSNTSGTGTIVLAGAQTGYQSFAVVGNGNQTYYTIADQSGSNWEVGIGTYYSGNVSLSRDTILASSNSNATVNFTNATHDVFVTYPAEKAVYISNGNAAPNLGNVSVFSVLASNGIYSTGIFQGTYTDGVVTDYLNGNARISAGAADNITFYNSGVANVTLLTIPSTGGIKFPDGTTQTTAASGSGSGLPAGANNSIGLFNVNLTANATINAGVNGFSVGPVTTANGVSITVSSGQRWVII